MREITLIKERQKIALDILLFVKSFCEENDIHFFLAYGTLLGAVRHNGFIPWDDDVDVMMTRNEYRKLLKCLYKLDHPYYRLISMHNNLDYFAPLARFYDDRTLVIQEYGVDEKVSYGIYVDLFIIDKMPDDYAQAEILYNKALKIKLKWAMSVRKINSRSTTWLRYIFRVPISIFFKCIGYRHYLKKYDELAASFEKTNTKHEGIIVYGEGLEKEYFLSAMFENPSSVSFEGVEFKAPANVDLYLKQMYGDYMTLPPVEDRKIHPNKAYWK